MVMEPTLNWIDLRTKFTFPALPTVQFTSWCQMLELHRFLCIS